MRSSWVSATMEDLSPIMCHYCRSLLKKSGCRTPRIELEEIGPSLDLVLRRTHLASDDLYKLAHRKPKALKVKPHIVLSLSWGKTLS